MCVVYFWRCVLLISIPRSLDMLMLVRTSASHQGILLAELELIQPHMPQKPVLRGEVRCACVAREVSVERSSWYRWSGPEPAYFRVRVPIPDCSREIPESGRPEFGASLVVPQAARTPKGAGAVGRRAAGRTRLAKKPVGMDL